MTVLSFLCSSWKCILSKYSTPLLFIIFADCSLFLALSLPPFPSSLLRIPENLYSVPLVSVFFYWRWETLLKVWENAENLKQSLSKLLPTDKVQAQLFLCISLHALEDPPKSLRTTYESPKVRWDQSKERSGKRNTLLKLAPSPISMEMIVKSAKLGETFLPWEQADHDRWQGMRVF